MSTTTPDAALLAANNVKGIEDILLYPTPKTTTAAAEDGEDEASSSDDDYEDLPDVYDTQRNPTAAYLSSSETGKALLPLLVDIQQVLNRSHAMDVVAGAVKVPIEKEEEEEKDNTVAVEGRQGGSDAVAPIPITFPLPLAVADTLAASLAPSPFGMEGAGDVVDPDRRRSVECSLLPTMNADAAVIPSAVVLPPSVLHFDFPEARNKIRQAFCGVVDGAGGAAAGGDDAAHDAANPPLPLPFDIVYHPYKFVLYRKGDFFMPHVDSMKDPRQIGSLALQVPVSGGGNDEDEKKVEDDDGDDAESNSGITQLDPSDYAEWQDDGEYNDSNKSNKSGRIVFYLGRQLQQSRTVRNGPDDDDYAPVDPPSHPRQEMKITVDLTSHLPQREADEEGAAVYRCKYAAWLGDIVHEVTRVHTKYRAVVLYRLYRVEGRVAKGVLTVAEHDAAAAAAQQHQQQLALLKKEEEKSSDDCAVAAAKAASSSSGGGDDNAWMGPLADRYAKTADPLLCSKANPAVSPLHRQLLLPANKAPYVSHVEATLHKIMKLLANNGSGDAPANPDHPQYLGVVLRHAYPPAGLLPIGLKGADAALYAIASHCYEVSLHCGYECKVDMPDVAYRAAYEEGGETSFNGYKVVYATTERIDSDLVDDERSDHAICKKYPVFVKGAWMQLGFGGLEGGGHVYGNCDCGVNWWYRSAVMIIRPTPSKRLRRMPLLLAGLKGPETMQQLMDVPDVFTHVMSYL